MARANSVLGDIRNRISLPGHNVLVFVGAGLSQGLPTWSGLLTELIREVPDEQERRDCDKYLAEGRFLEVASFVSDRVGRGHVRGYIQSRFASPSCTMPREYNLLAQLPVSHFATTNFDPWLKNALKQRHDKLRVFVPSGGDAVVVRNTSAPTVVYLHGEAANPATCVLTAEDYRNNLYGKVAYSSTLRNLLESREVLFIGFSLRDPNILAILDTISVAFQRGVEHWILTRPLDAVIKTALLGRGVIPIEIGEGSEWKDGEIAEVLSFLSDAPAIVGEPLPVEPRESVTAPESGTPRAHQWRLGRDDSVDLGHELGVRGTLRLTVTPTGKESQAIGCELVADPGVTIASADRIKVVRRVSLSKAMTLLFPGNEGAIRLDIKPSRKGVEIDVQKNKDHQTYEVTYREHFPDA